MTQTDPKTGCFTSNNNLYAKPEYKQKQQLVIQQNESVVKKNDNINAQKLASQGQQNNKIQINQQNNRYKLSKDNQTFDQDRSRRQMDNQYDKQAKLNSIADEQFDKDRTVRSTTEQEGFEDQSWHHPEARVQVDLVKGIMAMAKSQKLAAICGLLGGFMIHLVVGAIYRWNMIADLVGTYFDTSYETPVGAPLSMLCAGLTMRLGYKLSDKCGRPLILLVAMTTAVTGALVSSFTTTFLTFLVWHNIIFGMSAGLMFLLPLKQCHCFFPKMKLVTNTIVLTGTGLGAVLFGAYNIECIENGEETLQLSDLQISALVADNFQSCLIRMALMMTAVGLSGVALMLPMHYQNKRRNATQNQKVSAQNKQQLQSIQTKTEEQTVTVQTKIQQQTVVVRNKTQQQVDSVVIKAKNQRAGIQITNRCNSSNICPSQCTGLKSRVFWLLAVVIFLSSSGNFYVTMNYKNLLSQNHRQKIFLYWILISGALGNGLARFIWGCISSRVSFKILFCVACLINIAAFIAMMLTDSETTYLVFYTFNSASLGGLMVIFPNVTHLIFGQKLGQTIYSYYWITFAVANLFQFIITLILTQNPHQSSDYTEVLIFFAICVSVALFIASMSRLQGPWKNSLDLVHFRIRKTKNNL